MKLEELSTQQEIFDYLVPRLITQNAASFDKATNTNLYYGENNRRCAIGWLILDGDYKKEIEGIDVTRIIQSQVLTNRNVFNKNNKKFLEELQDVHDDWSHTHSVTFTKDFYLRLKAFAESFNLNTQILQEVVNEKA